MLTRETLLTVLNGIEAITDPVAQVIEGYGYDGIMDILANIRTIKYPVIILEGKSTGQFTILPGAMDTFTQSIWVMDNLSRSESEKQVFDDAFKLGRKIISKLLDACDNETSAINGWEPQYISYSKRSGGPNARGWEFVLTFKENTDLTNG